MNKLTRFSVNYPVTVLMMIFAILLLGYISFRKLSIDLFPDLNNPRLYVEIKSGERPPEEMEKQFVQNIESLAIRQKNVTRVSSVCRAGSAQVTVEYSWETDMDEAFLDLQKTLTLFSQNSELEEMNISQLDPNAVPVITLGFSHPQIDDMDELRRIAENYLRNELVRLEGIAEVALLGQEEKQVVVETNGYLLKAYNLTLTDLVNKISSYNRNVSGGSIVEMGKKYVIRGVSEFQDLENIGQVVVSYQQPVDVAGSAVGEPVPVFLKDVADIRFENKEPENIVHVNQKHCLALAVYKETRYNTVKAVSVVLESLEELRKALPGYELTVIQNQGKFVTLAINEVKQSAIIGIVLAVIVLYIFLRRIGTTLVISLAIPISIVATFNLMYFNGLTLNIMTLGGLALGAGMLVDNAIVVMENIMRISENGPPLKEASALGASQVGGAITSSTLTTIVVFLPIVYLHGAAGELFKDQAWTVTFALLSSLVVAILIIPMLSSRILKSSTARAHTLQFTRYAPLLRRIISRPWLYIGFGGLLLVGALVLLPFVGSEFIPQIESDEMTVELQLPEGTDLRRSEATITGIEQRLVDLLGDQIAVLFSTIGPVQQLSDADEYQEENTAVINLVLKNERKHPRQQIMAALDGILKDVPNISYQYKMQQGELQTILGIESAPVVVEIRGEELSTLRSLTLQAQEELKTQPELYNVETSFDQDREEINIHLDRIRAGLLNVNIDAVASELEHHLAGRKASEWEHQGETQDILLKLPNVSVQELAGIEVPIAQQMVRIDDIADIQIERVPKEIKRENQMRVGFVTAQLMPDVPLDQVIREINLKLGKLVFPTDYRYQISGEEEKRRESFAHLTFALLLSIILVYMVMASQFESLVHPFTILLTIPLALTGSIFIFIILGKSLNIMAYIGLVMLGGIAVNNSILLVDAINQLKREGWKLADAVVEAGSRRIRPILMTSLTTILGLLPLTVGFGEGAALRQPMALAVIGGLITSTLLTLVVIPCVYIKLDRFSR